MVVLFVKEPFFFPARINKNQAPRKTGWWKQTEIRIYI